jgi:hypothetical protein
MIDATQGRVMRLINTPGFASHICEKHIAF